MVLFPIGCTKYCFIKKQIVLHQHLFNKQHVSLCKDHCWEQQQCDRSLIPFLTIPARRALENKGARDGKIQVGKNPFPKIYFVQISSFFLFYFQAILLPATYFSPLFFLFFPNFYRVEPGNTPAKFSTPGPSAVHFQDGGRNCQIYGITFYKLICLTQVCCGSSVEEISYTFKIQI